MIDCLMLGQTNVGKTLLSLQLSKYAGNTSPFIMQQLPTGEIREHFFVSTKEAIKSLVSDRSSTTLGLQTMGASVGALLSRSMLLRDSTGLSSQAVEDKMVRLGMARTLEALVKTNMVLLVVDGSRLQAGALLDEVDEWALRFAAMRKIHRAVVVNKLDMPGVKRMSDELKRRWHQEQIFSTSALYEEGLGAVLQFLQRKGE